MNSHADLPVLKSIDTLEALKALADPLRTQVMEALYEKPLTVSQIADRLGVAPSKLYYHINQLEEHGFVQVVDTKVQGNIIEQSYWLTARNFELHRELLHFAGRAAHSELHQALLSRLDATRADLSRSIEAREFNREQGAQENRRGVMISREVNRIPDDRAKEFMGRLKEIVAEFSDAAPATNREAPNYALTIAFYPSFYYNEELDKPKDD